jgi:hypothetical protein
LPLSFNFNDLFKFILGLCVAARRRTLTTSRLCGQLPNPSTGLVM